MPSDTKWWLTNNDSEIIVFLNLRISCVIPWKCHSLLEILEAAKSKNSETNSQWALIGKRITLLVTKNPLPLALCAYYRKATKKIFGELLCREIEVMMVIYDLAAAGEAKNDLNCVANMHLTCTNMEKEKAGCSYLEDPNLLKWRSLDSLASMFPQR